VRRQLEETYQQLAAHAVEQGETLSVTREHYVGHFLSNYEARYQSHAVAGLALIGTPEARRALEEVMDRVRLGQSVYRGDVIEALSNALGVAASPGRPGWTTISAGSAYTCAIRTDSAAYCWGFNISGQLGDSTEVNKSLPTPVKASVGFTAIAAGTQHTCGLLRQQAYCWGENDKGQLGDSSISNDRHYPRPVVGGISLTGIAAGTSHTCAWTATGEAYCWGGNDEGQLGSTTQNRPWPAPVTGGLRFAALDAGGAHTCGSSPDARAYCWGSNDDGQLGDTSQAARPTPGTLPQPMRFGVISAGTAHTCGLTRRAAAVRDAQAYCVGRNQDGQLGDDTQASRDSLLPIIGGLRFVTLAAGARHTCGLTVSSREAWCWGNNEFGQLGDSTKELRLQPVRVFGSPRFAAISAGGEHTCGVTVRGEAYCWGRNDAGQVGDGTTEHRVAPALVPFP
jgi:alpha-tubulin suppressor-like RCC1 family protein